MVSNWWVICTLAEYFYVEERGKELWLVKYKTDLIDGPVEFPVGSGNIINIPFRPHILACKADKKEAPVLFPLAAERWINETT